MKKAEATKQRILEIAGPIYNKKGIAGTAVDEVLSAAQVARGCLYNHFESKDGLSIAVSDYLLKRTTEAIKVACAKEKTAVGKINAYLSFYKNALNTYTDGGCPIFNLAVEADNNNPAVKDMLKNVMTGAQRYLTGILTDGVTSGELTDKLDVNAFALKIFSAVEGAVIICRIMESNRPMVTLINALKNELNGFKA
jgi:TetR/AcrR family transcriptional repressor of nem operon